jgi:molybdopterin synthase sulfur carrier subunit
MRVKVRGYLTLREVIGGQPFRVVEAERLTVQELLGQLVRDLEREHERKPARELDELAAFAQAVSSPTSPRGTAPHFAILVNGRHCSHLPDGLQTELSDGDEVSIFPPAAGGE